MSDTNTNWVLPAIVVVAVAAGAIWYFQKQDEPVTAVEAPGEAEPAPAEPAGPRYPVPLPGSDAAGELVDLPPLDDSDAYFELALLDVFGPALDDMLVDSGLVEKFVTTVDNLPRARVAERVRPLKNIGSAFVAEPLDGENAFVLGEDNYARYSPFVDLLQNAGTDDLIDAYRRFYPLLQEAYVGLGYPDRYFNDRVIEVIDHLLQTPEPAEPPRLARPHVLYVYADPELEALSAGQKLLLRMGNANADRVKDRLVELRERLVAFDGG
jgi:hypothetical protein